ncbi:MAG: class I SAM-dependent methyltransferase [Lachnospiraceae bacterium]|nr:class I SAM-dependent methyltransferase [Lachnospiraceae bacterium]
MDAYTGFAAVYDTFMDNVPYEEWVSYLQELLIEYGITGGLVLDLGCGTGTVTELLASKGYDMIGIDNSQEMLNIAIAKKDISNHDILYLLQDMRMFELYGTVKGIVSICDSINYITEEEDLLEVFKLANNYLDPKGIFIFDFNTVYKYQEVLGNCTIAENREECSFIWDNNYYEEDEINEYELSLFIREEGENADNNRYRKYEETHFQKAYNLNTIKKLLKKSGLVYITAYDAFTKQVPTNVSERIYVVARECGK